MINLGSTLDLLQVQVPCYLYLYEYYLSTTVVSSVLYSISYPFFLFHSPISVRSPCRARTLIGHGGVTSSDITMKAEGATDPPEYIHTVYRALMTALQDHPAFCLMFYSTQQTDRQTDRQTQPMATRQRLAPQFLHDQNQTPLLDDTPFERFFPSVFECSHVRRQQTDPESRIKQFVRPITL